MYSKKQKFWRKYHDNIVSTSFGDALFLSDFLKQCRMNEMHLHTFEIIDVRRYRIIKRKYKIEDVLRLQPSELTFLFPVNKN